MQNANQQIQSPIEQMVNLYNSHVEELKATVKMTNLSEAIKKQMIETRHAKLDHMKMILEASGMVEFFSDSSCKIIANELFKLTEPNDLSEEKLPGAFVQFTSAGSSGHRTNHLGNGEISLHLHSAGRAAPWTSIGEIYFSSPNKEQLERMETAPSSSSDFREFCNYKRRLSFKQACFLQEKIAEFIMFEFKGIIPTDDEIDDMKRMK